MKIDKKNKKIELRCTDIASSIECPARIFYKWELEQLQEKEVEPSLQQKLGTELHKVMVEILKYPKEKRANMSPEIDSILRTPAKFPVMDLTRAGLSITTKEFFKNSSFLVYVDNKPEAYVLNTSSDFITKNSDPSVPIEVSTIPEKDRIKIQSKTRGAHGRLEIEGASSCLPERNNTTIEEALSLYPQVFGQELIYFEKRTEFYMHVRGWDILMGGTLDAATINGNLIVDWKTIGQAPSMNTKAQHAAYYVQPAIYRRLMCITNEIPISESFMILAFIVKPRKRKKGIGTPKFMPISFRLTKQMIEFTWHLIYRNIHAAIDYAEKRLVPQPSVGFLKCDWCTARTICEQNFRVFPAAVDINHVIFNKSN